MASNSSKAIPFVVIAVVVGSLAVEVHYDTEIDLESIEPLLIAMGVGGIPLAAFKQAVAARKALPKNIEDIIREEIKNKLPDKS